MIMVPRGCFQNGYWLSFALAGLMLGGCGGPLSYTVNDSSVPDAKRAELVSVQKTVDDAERARDAAKAQMDSAESEVDAAESNLELREGDLEIAKKALELEEAKADAARAADVGGGEARLKASKKAVAVAEARLALAKVMVDYRAAGAKEAEKAWLTALASYELAKLKAVGEQGADADRRRADFEKQLADQQAEQADARRDLAEVSQMVEDRKKDLKEAYEY
jgi:chromosome segregation ATPase